MIRTVIAAAALAAISPFLATPTATADTETCASRAEYENLEFGLTVNQVYNRFDVYGYYIDDTQAYFRRGYKTCWAPGERRIIIEFSYDTGGSVDWYVRDVN